MDSDWLPHSTASCRRIELRQATLPNPVASSAVQSLGAGISVPYLDNRYTTTKIEPHPLDIRKAEMKSIDMLSYEHSRTGKGSNNPAGLDCSTLSCWHTRHVLT
ncbi:hypothetical protein LIER_07139 [Lithospermum erythrorhizon]|uniref:Uncharacterized protein n=1 Tax=Lithospermum erythrorhizon TaxID=34254 RepID=A0AAV3PAW2_LITER